MCDLFTLRANMLETIPKIMGDTGFVPTQLKGDFWERHSSPHKQKSRKNTVAVGNKSVAMDTEIVIGIWICQFAGSPQLFSNVIISQKTVAGRMF